MEYRKLGKSDMRISPVCLGSWVFGGDSWGRADDEESVRVVKRAVEKGINLIDTAPVYGSGRAERVIGRAIRDMPEKPLIATKCGLQMKGRSIRPNLSAEFIREEVENSLRRLNVDRIDLYQCHWPDPRTSLEETFSALLELRDEGKIRYAGLSNFQAEEMSRAADRGVAVSDQVRYSVLDREVEEELIPLCGEKGFSLLCYGTLGGGILTGKYSTCPDFPRGDVRSFFYKYYREPFWSRARRVVDVMEEVASRRGVPVSQVAVNWVLGHDEVAGCIVGCRDLEQLESNAGAADWALDAGDVDIIEKSHAEAFSGQVR